MNENYKTAPKVNRRHLFRLGGVGAIAALGYSIPFKRNLTSDWVPAAFAQDAGSIPESKSELTLLGDRPLNMEAAPHLLNDSVTPGNRFFVRNNGIPPDISEIDPASWTLTIDGEVDKPLKLTIADLKSNFEIVTHQLQIECAGNGRKFYQPDASGNQWTFGAIACAQWTGVRLKDVLEAAGLKSSAVYTAHYGADRHLSGDPEKDPLSRGIPISKALNPYNLIAWSMNGEDIPLLNGHPLRLVVPGWPGSCSQKWLNRIWIRDQVHDGAKMTGKAYRVPAYPVAPGTSVPDSDLKIIESLPVKSLITHPATGHRVKPGETFFINGHAWAGDLVVKRVEVSLDFGATWQDASLDDPVNPFAWQQWSAALSLAEQGYYEIWARATDENGKTQPATTPGWNPKGYLNNMQHRIAVFGVA